MTSIQDYFPNETSSDITDLIDKLALAASSSIYAQLHSPGDISIQDSKGRMIGVVDGVVRNDFPFASYDPEEKFIRIFFPDDDSYVYKVVGTDTGVYGIDIAITKGTKIISYQNRNIPLKPSEVHEYTLDKTAILNGEKGIMFKVDGDGDGIIEETAEYNATVQTIRLAERSRPLPVVSSPLPAPTPIVYPTIPFSTPSSTLLEINIATSTIPLVESSTMNFLSSSGANTPPMSWWRKLASMLLPKFMYKLLAAK